MATTVLWHTIRCLMDRIGVFAFAGAMLTVSRDSGIFGALLQGRWRAPAPAPLSVDGDSAGGGAVVMSGGSSRGVA